jgi:hypothetical protein
MGCDSRPRARAKPLPGALHHPFEIQKSPNTTVYSIIVSVDWIKSNSRVKGIGVRQFRVLVDTRVKEGG